jgi:hypothetical protein
MYRIPFWAIVPTCALSAPDPVPMMIYGHGLLGTGEQAASGALRDTASTLCYVIAGTDMRGMSEPDVANVLLTLNDLSKSPLIFDVLIQGVINHIALQHIMRGPMAQTLFVDEQGQSLVDPTQLVFYGLSQGHIFGSTVMAYDNFITRGVVGVGAANYSMMLERSVNWPTYELVLKAAYPQPLGVPLAISLMQLGWDLTDPSGSANAALTGDIPGTPPKQMLLHMSLNDAQVPNVATEWQVRTMGLSVVGPTPYEMYGAPTTLDPIVGGSGITIYDGGFDPVPLTNTAPEDNGAHGLTRRQAAALRQMAAFYTAGIIVQECDGVCTCATGACD